jgi:hypothetical protein
MIRVGGCDVRLTGDEMGQRIEEKRVPSMSKFVTSWCFCSDVNMDEMSRRSAKQAEFY